MKETLTQEETVTRQIVTVWICKGEKTPKQLSGFAGLDDKKYALTTQKKIEGTDLRFMLVTCGNKTGFYVVQIDTESGKISGTELKTWDPDASLEL